ncbi:hypothetical protein JCM12296A_23020 [Desulfosarcina cetonica]
MFINIIILTSLVITPIFISSCGTEASVQQKDQVDIATPINCLGKKISKNSKNTTKPGLITENNHFYGKSCYAEVISNIFETSTKPIVLFVHGRGKHPSKTIKENLIKNIRDQYNVSVLSFTWPSWEGPSGFPDTSAMDSSDELTEIIKTLYRVKTNGAYKNPLSMLTHSMGSIVLQGIVEKELDNTLTKNIFKNIVINASASSQKNHGEWISNIDFAENIYIVSNTNDKALLCLEGKPKIVCKFLWHFDMSPRLGRIDSSNIDDTAANAHYVNFTDKLGKKHRYYINQTNSPSVFNFYNTTLNGKNFIAN